MFKFGNVTTVIKYIAENKCNSSIGHTILKSYGVNVVQTRCRHVMDDSMEPHRVFRHDKKTGARTSSEIVLKKFFRLHWGGWIRGISNRDVDIWKRSNEERRYGRKHVLCGSKQCTLLDKMVTREYRDRRYYVDDPYEPYQTREEFMHTRTKPLPPSKNVYQFIDD